jgi:predicted nuclease of predicted toxin-antitoxin system
VKYLIDECLSPELAILARDNGFLESAHVSWLGMSGQPDWAIARRAIDDGFILVTHNTVDFRPLYGRVNIHAGLIAFNTAPNMMDRSLQKQLFVLAMNELAGHEPYNAILEITVRRDGRILIERYDLPF